MSRSAVFAFILVLAPASSALSSGPHHDRFAAVAEAFLAEWFRTHPVRATELGMHAHDHELPDLSRKAVSERIDALRSSLREVTGLERDRLTGDAWYDHRVLEYAIRAELLELEEAQGYRHNPMVYARIVADGVASLVDRRFDTTERRTEALTSRLRGVGTLLGQARKNLKSVPRLWSEIACRNVRGTVSFLERDVPAALAAQGIDEVDPLVVRRFERARTRAVARLGAFADRLERDTARGEDGEFRLGRTVFERKLRYEEHVDLTVEELTALNEQAITEYRDWVRREAARIDPDRSPAAVMDEVTADHPAAHELIETARELVLAARDLVRDRRILTLPTEDLPLVRPTPEYARSGFASMSTPGPFEERATEAYYNVTNVDPEWSEEQQEQHLTYFNYAGLLGISVHEAMPGHFVQLHYQRKLPTALRKVFAPRTLVEGWAHYTEQMMVDEGLGAGDPRIRLGQLRRALQRHARWHAGLALHVYGAEIEETAKEFEEIAYFAPFPALRETQRATYDPTYLYYALGRMQILGLRDEVMEQDPAGDLREFHDTFLRLGLPIELARHAMLRGD